MEQQKIFDIICRIEAIIRFAKEIHYSVKGTSMYGNHLFADKISDSDVSNEFIDLIKEVFYLGRSCEIPPIDEVLEGVLKHLPKISDSESENFISLQDLIVALLVEIEILEGLTRGEENLIGAVAQEMQQINGLLGRLLKNGSDQYVFNSGFKESEHPREKNGRFSKKAENFLGKEFTGVKGQEAIDVLMREQQGHIKDAFTRKETGDIALVWGDDNMGLQHILKRRQETNQPLGRLLQSLTDVIEKGELEEQGGGRFRLRYKGKSAIVEPHLFESKISFVFTAFYEK